MYAANDNNSEEDLHSLHKCLLALLCWTLAAQGASEPLPGLRSPALGWETERTHNYGVIRVEKGAGDGEKRDLGWGGLGVRDKSRE